MRPKCVVLTALLMGWIADGAPYHPPPALADEVVERISRWEIFLNGRSDKQQLMSRYIYEHLFMGHIYFDDMEERKYFRLVRSRSVPGVPIDQIATRRPYDDPGVERVYYRLQPVRTTILAETHLPYAFGEARMARYRELFLSPSYEVTELPGYAPEVASNPFIAFHSIPGGPDARFTLVRNTGHSNVSHLLTEKQELLPDEDTLTVAVGLLGAYPNAFYRVDRKHLPALVTAISTLASEADYAALVDRFGVRRSDPAFWEHSDDLFAAFETLSPLEAGRFDYNRLENR